jgi:hypothetical protein
MYPSRRWVSKATWIALITLSTVAMPCAASAQARPVQVPRHFFSVLADEARDIFNAGQMLYDQDNFVDAEKRFREVIQRFPRHIIADRADYYLIRTLTQLGKKAEALSRINAFARTYPRSRWSTDVEELKIKLTNQVSPAAERVLLQAPLPPPAPSAAPIPAAASRTVVVRQQSAETANFDVSLQQEIMRAMFRSAADRRSGRYFDAQHGCHEFISAGVAHAGGDRQEFSKSQGSKRRDLLDQPGAG